MNTWLGSRWLSNLQVSSVCWIMQFESECVHGWTRVVVPNGLQVNQTGTAVVSIGHSILVQSSSSYQPGPWPRGCNELKRGTCPETMGPRLAAWMDAYCQNERAFGKSFVGFLLSPFPLQ